MTGEVSGTHDTGSDETVELRTGAVRAFFDNGTLRDVSVGDALALLQIYVAVRDANWGTVPAVLHDVQLAGRPDGFRITFRALHDAPGIAFAWHGTIDADAGTITFRMAGRAERDFMAGRIGFCLLHPLSLAGTPVSVRTSDGVRRLQFPLEISGTQPLPEMSGMSYDVGRHGHLDVAFEGDLFETEDQRNWTDASYKTYCTPLRLPYPRTINAGERIEQIVTLTASGSTSSRRLQSQLRTTLLVDVATPLPQLPALGLGVHSQGGPLDDSEIALVKRLRPEHLRASLDLADATWSEELASAVAEAQTVGVDLDLDVASHDNGKDLVALIPQIERHRDVVRRLYVFDFGSWATGGELAQRARDLLDAGHLVIPLGGGSMANYAEFNRADLPVTLLDFTTFSINPQVHAFDDRSILETLAAQSQTVASARRRCGLPISVGPVTLRPRFNAVASGAQSPGRGYELPPAVDPRQAAPLAAAWTIGSVLALAAADSVTYYETAGWRGTFSRSDPRHEHPDFPAAAGTIFPAYDALLALAEVAGQPRLAVGGGDGSVAALAVKRDDAITIIAANLTPDARTVDIEADGESEAVELAGYATSVLHLSERRVIDARQP